MIKEKDSIIEMKPMRKQSRQKDSLWALEVFDKAPFVTISMITPEGTPYGLPISMVRKDNTTFYFHCAFEGEKIDCLNNNPHVCLSAVSKCTPTFEEDKRNYTEHYNSAIAFGRCSQVNDPGEKIEALRLLCQRFLPKYMEFFDEAISRSLERTNVIRVTLTAPPVGKSKQ